MSRKEVVAATRGVDAIYWVDPSVMSEDPLADYARATDALVRAVVANGIGRVVFQSSVGAEKRHGAGEIDGLAATEVALDALGVDVTHLSWSQVAEIMTHELGREVVAERVSDAEMRQQYLDAGMPEAMADAVLGMSTGLRDGFVPEQARSVVTTTPTTLCAWVREELVG